MSILTFYHNDYSCPWIKRVQSFLQYYSVSHNHKYEDVNYHDMYKNELLNGFPFAIYVDGSYATNSPVFPFNVDDVFEQKYRNIEIIDNDLENAKIDSVEIINSKVMCDSIAVCTNGDNHSKEKEKWYNEKRKNVYGFVGYKGNKPKVMLEIICFGKKAQIHCFYSNDEKGDYKASLYDRCLIMLKNKGIHELEVVVGKNSYYPNGSMNHFYEMGFKEKMNIGKTYLLNKGYDSLIRMTATL